MQLRWIGVILIGLALFTSMACIGGIVLIALTSSDTPSGDHVAVVDVHGQIVTRGSGGLFAADDASAEEIIEQLEEIRENSAVQALILDIDSPGGGVLATEQIHAELLRVQGEGIPIVAYLGNSAASGGYYIAAVADVIVSNPSTITGSIGVISQVPNMEELYEKLGIEMQIIATGEFKDMMQPARPLTDEEREIIASIQAENFEAFVSAIVTGRDMSEEEVLELADGRIYSGRQAFENGLVDELGDFRAAVQVAGDLSGLGDDPVLRDYSPSPPGFWDIFFGVTAGDLDISLPSLFDLDVDPRDVYIEFRYGTP
jgi:protease IV